MDTSLGNTWCILKRLGAKVGERLSLRALCNFRILFMKSYKEVGQFMAAKDVMNDVPTMEEFAL